MRIDIAPQQYVINVPRKVGRRVESDFLIRALRIRNNSDEEVRIEAVSFDLLAQGKAVRRVSCPRQALKYQFERVSRIAPQMKGYGSQVFLGRERFFSMDRITTSLRIPCRKEAGILLQHFRVIHESAVDACYVSVDYAVNGTRKRMRKRVKVVSYKNKNTYIFPLKGAWLVVNNFDDIHEHRQMHSQEFAMDLIQLTSNFKLARSKRFANRDYPSYGRRVRAIARGKVVACFSEFPENPPGLGSRLPKEKWQRLINKYGFLAGVAGNYVILKHRSKEYSFYAHMIPGSVKVKKDEMVKKGQGIGRLGNSGNSDAPHLHFHLMDGSNFLTARGLPCSFVGLRDAGNEAITLIEENLSIVFAS